MCTGTLFDCLRGSGNLLFAKALFTQRTRNGRTKVLSFKRFSGISTPAALFLDIPLTMFLTNSFSKRLKRKCSFQGTFLVLLNNARVRSKFVNNYFNIKVLNFGSSGHSNKTRILVTD